MLLPPGSAGSVSPSPFPAPSLLVSLGQGGIWEQEGSGWQPPGSFIASNAVAGLGVLCWVLGVGCWGSAQLELGLPCMEGWDGQKEGDGIQLT